MAKYQTIVRRLIRRIEAGDYATRRIPAERALAEEFSVSYMTARKAIGELIDQGWLRRQANGRLDVDRQRVGQLAGRQVALLVPAFASPDLERWRRAVDSACAARGWRARMLLYVHWEDPIIVDALAGNDGVFLVPTSEDALPASVASAIHAVKRPLVVLDHDWSHLGLPSVQLFSPRCMRSLLDLLAGLGHRRVDLFNVQAHDHVILDRIAAWRTGLADLGLAGDFHDHAVELYGDPFAGAREGFSVVLDRGITATAVIATTIAAALGVVRLSHERGVAVPGDLSLAVINGEGLAGLAVPSITAVEPVDPQAALMRCLDWMAAGGPWPGHLVSRPGESLLALRESTGPCKRAERSRGGP